MLLAERRVVPGNYSLRAKGRSTEVGYRSGAPVTQPDNEGTTSVRGEVVGYPPCDEITKSARLVPCFSSNKISFCYKKRNHAQYRAVPLDYFSSLTGAQEMGHTEFAEFLLFEGERTKPEMDYMSWSPSPLSDSLFIGLRRQNLDTALNQSSAGSNCSLPVNSPLFRNLDRHAITAITQSARRRAFAAGEFLCRLGEPATRLYLLISGVVKIIGYSRA